MIIGKMAKYKNKEVLSEILKRFHGFLDDEKYQNDDILPASIRSVVYMASIKNGGENELNALKKYYNYDGIDAMDKSSALRAMGYVNYNDEAIHNLLEWVMNSDEVRKQDKVFPYRCCANSGQRAREISWQFLQKRWAEWFKLFEGGFLVQHLAKIPSGFVTLEKAKEVEAFYSGIDEPVCKRSMKQCVEAIVQNATWRNKELENIRKWTQQNI